MDADRYLTWRDNANTCISANVKNAIARVLRFFCLYMHQQKLFFYIFGMLYNLIWAYSRLHTLHYKKQAMRLEAGTTYGAQTDCSLHRLQMLRRETNRIVYDRFESLISLCGANALCSRFSFSFRGIFFILLPIFTPTQQETKKTLRYPCLHQHSSII